MSQPRSLLDASPISAPRRVAAAVSWRGRTLAQWYCLVVGVLLGLRGAQQFIVGASFATPGEGWRASQQLLTAVLLLLAHRNRVAAVYALILFAAYYTVVSIVGDFNGHEAFGLLPVDGRDLIVHPVYAISAAAIVWLEMSRRAAQRRDTPA